MSVEITYGSLTFSDVITGPSAGTYELVWSSCPEMPSPRQEAIHKHFGLDGLRIVDGGAGPRAWHMTGRIVAADLTGLTAAYADLRTANSSGVDDLVRFGETLEDVDCPGGFRLGKISTGQYIYQDLDVTWRQA